MIHNKHAFLLLIYIVLSINVLANNYYDTKNISYEILPDGTAKVISCRKEKNIIIPEMITCKGRVYTVTGFQGSILNDVETLSLPKSIASDISCYQAKRLKYISVNEENPSLKTVNGVLYSKDMEELIWFPGNHKDLKAFIPIGVKRIKKKAFNQCIIKELYIPYSVSFLESGWLSECHCLTKIIYERSGLFNDFYESKYDYKKLKKKNVICDIDLTAYLMLADRGNVQAQYALGEFMYIGNVKSLPQNISQATNWFSKAGEQDYVPAILRLIDIYSTVNINPTKVLYWRIRATALKHNPSMVALADLYLKGEGVKKDTKKGIQLYIEAAQLGNYYAAGCVGDFYYNGYKPYVVQDKARAIEWFKYAAKGGNVEAAYRIGMCYYLSDGVWKDEKKALDYLKMAVSANYSMANNIYSLLAYKEAERQMDKKAYDVAADWFNEVVQYDRNNLAACVNAGYCYLSQAYPAYELAELCLNQALKLDPTNQAAKNNLAIIAQYKSIKALIKQYILNGDSYYNAGNYEKAVDSYSKSISMEKNDPYPYYMIARCFFACGAYQETIEFCDKALVIKSYYVDAKKLRKSAKSIIVLNAISQTLNTLSGTLNTIYANNSMYNTNTSNSSGSTNSSPIKMNVSRRSKECSLCHGTGWIDSNDTPTFSSNSSEQWCDGCKRMVSASHCHQCKECPSCRGKGITLL